jgi:lipid-A-disaccharide synthase
LKIYIIAGEASGDLHGSNLVKELLRLNTSLQLRGWGGDLMAKAGVNVVKHYRDLAFMGFIEVVKNLPTIMRNFRFCKEDILAYRPDALILIDYPGFNLRMAKWAHEQGIPVLYYIAPQAWAWKENRVHAMRKHIDQLYVVLPFEESFFQKHGISVFYSGHPVLDTEETNVQSRDAFFKQHALSDQPLIALLPGSRKQEIRAMLPVMARMKAHYPEYTFVIAGAPGQTPSFYREVLADDSIPVLFGATSGLLRHAKAGLITSGTATLEAGISGLPQVVCYKGSAISYAIAKRLVKVKYISLVNLILDKPAVRELIQHDFNEESLKTALDGLLNDTAVGAELTSDYAHLRTCLGGPGASRRTATHMLKILQEQSNASPTAR